MTKERREHQRLAIRLPVEVRRASSPDTAPLRTTTRNVSTGGVYFETPRGEFAPGAQVDVHLSIPPGEGYFPYAGCVHGTAQVLRIEPLILDARESSGEREERDGVAARFRRSLKLEF
jgi:hypothetical protein